MHRYVEINEVQAQPNFYLSGDYKVHVHVYSINYTYSMFTCTTCSCTFI